MIFIKHHYLFADASYFRVRDERAGRYRAK